MGTSVHLGPWLLVAPIYGEGETRSVYLPQGRWIDYWNGRGYEGPATIQVRAPLDTLPLFVKAGAIIPMMPPANRIPQGRIDPLVIEVYPSGESAYQFLEDEGVTAYHCQEDGQQIVFEVRGGLPRSMVLHFRYTGKITHAVAQGEREAILRHWETREDGTVELQLAPSTEVRVTLTRA